MLLLGHHVETVVTLIFSLTHVTCIALHQTVVIRYSTTVAYGTLCHASGHLVIYRQCYRFERAFFTLRPFLPCTPSSFFKAYLGYRSTSKLAGIHADLQNIAPVALFVCTASIYKRLICGSFFLRVRAG